MHFLRLAALASTALAAAIPIQVQESSQTDVSIDISDLQERGNTPFLRILPLGASITYGVGSTEGNGYRLSLWYDLEAAGFKLNYVGSMNHGQMIHNAVEGYPGNTIAQVDQKAASSGAYNMNPNVVLLHVGTNECNLAGQDVAHAPDRYLTLLNNLKQRLPNALVIASTLIHNRDQNVDNCINNLNNGLRNAVQRAKAGGQKVTIVDMWNAVPMDTISTTDKTHPNNVGYARMSKAWLAGIQSSVSMISP